MRRPLISSEGFRFARDGAILVNASALTGFIYLLVHPILGRAMDKVAYGSFVQLMGLLAVLSVPSNAFRVAISRYVAEFAHGNQLQLWVTVVRRASRRITVWGILALAVWTLASFWLTDVLRAPNRASVVVVGVIAFISLYTPIVQGTLQGAMNFVWLSLTTLSGAILRVILAGAVAWLHGGVDMVLLAVAVSILAGVFVGYWPFHRVLAETPSIEGFDTGPIYRYLWPVLLGQGAVFALANADIILFGRFLTGNTLAAYGKVATLSRIVLFLSQPIALAMFPRAVTSARLRVLVAPLGVAFCISLCGALGLFLLPALPMRLMYGVVDPVYDALTRQYVWAALPHAMAMFISQYLWARHQTLRVLWLLPVLAAYLVALALFHGTPEAMIRCLALAGWAAFAITLAGAVWRGGGRSKKDRLTTETRKHGAACARKLRRGGEEARAGKA